MTFWHFARNDDIANDGCPAARGTIEKRIAKSQGKKADVNGFKAMLVKTAVNMDEGKIKKANKKALKK